MNEQQRMEARSWPDDYGHENGNYVNCCSQCQQPFVGHKRRVLCRECTPSIEQQQVEEFLRAMDDANKAHADDIMKIAEGMQQRIDDDVVDSLVHGEVPVRRTETIKPDVKAKARRVQRGLGLTKHLGGNARAMALNERVPNAVTVGTNKTLGQQRAEMKEKVKAKKKREKAGRKKSRRR